MVQLTHFLRLFLFSLMLFPVFSHAQSGLVRGKITDSVENAPIPGAYVRLNTLQDSVIRETVTDTEGSFLLRSIPEGKYKLSISSMGYSTRSQLLDMKRNERKDLGSLPMQMDVAELGAVEVQGKPLPVQIKGDTTEFAAGAFTTPPYADAEELIKKLPGVEVGQDGSVKAQGEDIRRVLVDGKEFFGNDPQIAMKNLPADIIDKIQIIDAQSEQARFTGFDDGNRVKTMNIVTRPDRRKGKFGRIYAGMGNEDRYNAGGNYNYFDGDRRLSILGMTNNVNQQNFSNEDILGVMGGGGGRGGRGDNQFYIGNSSGQNTTNALGVNYTDEWADKLELTASYFFTTRDNELQELLNREYILGGNANQLRLQNSESNSQNFNHRVNLRMEYEIDSMNSLYFRPNISFMDNERTNLTLSETTMGSGQTLNNSDRNTLAENSGYRLDGDLTFRHRFHKRGRTISLSVNGNSNTNRAYTSNYSLNRYFGEEAENRLDTIDQLRNSRSGGWGFSSRLAYTEPLGTYSRLQANYSLRNTESSSERETYDYLAATGQYDLLNLDLSNEFLNDYFYHRAGLAYQYSKNGLSFDFGLNFQSASIENHQVFPEHFQAGGNFTSLLPEASLSYELEDNRRLRLNYRTDTDPPSISDLQNVIDNSDPLNIRSGNPDLKQAFAHSWSLRYSSFNRESERHFFAYFSADLSNNRVVNSTFIARGDTTIDGVYLGKGAQFTRPENIDGFYGLRAHASYGMPIESLKLRVNFNTGLRHDHDVGYLNLQSTWSNSYGVNQGISVNSNISEKINFGLGTNLNYNITRNKLQPALNDNYFSQNISINGTWIFWKGLSFYSNFNYYYNKGYSEGYDQRFLLWNAAIGKRFLQKQNAEIKLSAYDLLNKNTSIVRNVTERFIEDSQTNILRQYFLLSFTYNLRSFGPGRQYRGPGGSPMGRPMGRPSF